MRQWTRWMLAGTALMSTALFGCSGPNTSGTKAASRSTSRTPASASGTLAPGANTTDALVRAEGYRHQGDMDRALAEFERVIETNPLMTVAYLGAGDIYRERGDYVAAEARYAAAAKVEPRNFDAQFYHGLSLQLLNRVQEAVRAYLRALAIRPNDFEANRRLAMAYLDLNEPIQALPYAQRSVALRSDSGPARANLAAVYVALGRYEAAVTEYQQAAELTRLGPDILLNMADALGYLERYAEMASTLDQLLRIEPSPAAYERMGKAMFKLRRYDQAMQAFANAIALDASYYPAHNGLGVCQLNQYLWSKGENVAARDEAIKSLRRSLQIEPKQPRIVELVRRYGV
ncbi:MAG: tetratricopeptide repeat protein [Phycisphaerales bacterium]|nr:tetratricopeptide repeat protein [Phycisphaerales bacterium]